MPKIVRFREARNFNSKNDDKIKKINSVDDNDEDVNENQNIRLKNRINLNEEKNLGYFKKIHEFLKAPIVKFAYDKVF